MISTVGRTYVISQEVVVHYRVKYLVLYKAF